jgi:hypothetical protein
MDKVSSTQMEARCTNKAQTSARQRTTKSTSSETWGGLISHGIGQRVVDLLIKHNPHRSRSCLNIQFLVHSSINTYSGTRTPIALQKSHLIPLPPSQVQALTKEKVFCNPGPMYSVTLIFFPSKSIPTVENSWPPVSLRLSWYGLAFV